MEPYTNKELCKNANRFQLELIQVGHARVTPAWSGGVTSPVHSRLYYVMRGSFFVISPDQKKTVFSAGSWHFLPAGYSCALSPWEASVVGFLKLRKLPEIPGFLPQIDRLLKISFQPVHPILWTNVDEKFLSTSCNYYIRSSDYFKYSLSF